MSKPKQVRERRNAETQTKAFVGASSWGCVCVSCDSVRERTESLGVCRLLVMRPGLNTSAALSVCQRVKKKIYIAECKTECVYVNTCQERYFEINLCVSDHSSAITTLKRTGSHAAFRRLSVWHLRCPQCK